MAIALLLGFSLAAPLFALDTAANLPACCRRNGAHHCVGGMTEDAGTTQVLIAPRCPDFPKSTAIFQRYQDAAPVASHSEILLFAHPGAQSQISARYRIACMRNRYKRGPPTILL